LDVIERVVEDVRGDELFGDLEGRRASEHVVAPRQSAAWREPGALSGSAVALVWWGVGDELVDLGVGWTQQRLVDDVGDDEVPIGSEPPQIVVRQPRHRRTVSRGWGPAPLAFRRDRRLGAPDQHRAS